MNQTPRHGFATVRPSLSVHLKCAHSFLMMKWNTNRFKWPPLRPLYFILQLPPSCYLAAPEQEEVEVKKCLAQSFILLFSPQGSSFILSPFSSIFFCFFSAFNHFSFLLGKHPVFCLLVFLQRIASTTI